MNGDVYLCLMALRGGYSVPDAAELAEMHPDDAEALALALATEPADARRLVVADLCGAYEGPPEPAP